MTATITDVDTSLELIRAVEEAFEQTECAGCDQFAAAVLVIEPCGCSAPFCSDCRKSITRTFNFRSACDIPQTCRGCDTVAWAIRWEPLR